MADAEFAQPLNLGTTHHQNLQTDCSRGEDTFILALWKQANLYSNSLCFPSSQPTNLVIVFAFMKHMLEWFIYSFQMITTNQYEVMHPDLW